MLLQIYKLLDEIRSQLPGGEKIILFEIGRFGFLILRVIWVNEDIRYLRRMDIKELEYACYDDQHLIEYLVSHVKQEYEKHYAEKRSPK